MLCESMFELCESMCELFMNEIVEAFFELEDVFIFYFLENIHVISSIYKLDFKVHCVGKTTDEVAVLMIIYH